MKFALINGDSNSVGIFNAYTLCSITISSPYVIENNEVVPLGYSSIKYTKYDTMASDLTDELYERCSQKNSEGAQAPFNGDSEAESAEEITQCGIVLVDNSSAWRFKTYESNYSMYSIGKNYFVWKD